jgi:mRNA-degrading endonuclease RelE of RelBE toxin-antitoxin system
MKVLTTRDFMDKVAELLQLYPSVISDLAPVIAQIKRGDTPGDRVPRVGGRPVYKARVPNRDAQRGKSGGYRVIYYLVDGEKRLLLTMYSKSERQDISPEEIVAVLRKWESDQKQS